jgi:hypothetical protein
MGRKKISKEIRDLIFLMVVCLHRIGAHLNFTPSVRTIECVLHEIGLFLRAVLHE